MELKIVRFKTAKELKEIGFNICDIGDCFRQDGILFKDFMIENYYHAPTLALVQMWFMDNHKLIIQVTPFDGWGNWLFKILAEDCMSPFFEAHDEMEEFNTYDEALEAGILEAIKLIKKV
jgi:hypothetical protein